METSGELTAHLTSGAVAVYMIEWLKTQSWFPFLRADTKTLNRIASAGLAFAAVVGISWNYDPFVGGDIHVPAVSVLLVGGWEWIKQYVMQQVLFDAVVQKSGASHA